MMSVEQIDESKVQETFGSSCIDLVSSALGSEILSVSDEFFASASNLTNPHPPIRRANYFVETGAWYDGWETRRHNPQPSDWVIIKLGVSSGVVHGVEVDTTFFNGNHALSVTVEGCYLTGSSRPDNDTTEWVTILTEQECGPSRRHVWRLPVPTEMAFTHVRLQMYPDGGIARFRLYGNAVPVWPEDPTAIVDLAHVANGGLAVSCSDQHFGTKDNLLLPGRGKNMGEGWETKRSRGRGHVDWVIVKLGALGYIEEVIVDTLHFRGNFPQAVEIYAINVPKTKPDPEDPRWERITEKTPCQKDHEHAFPGTLLKDTKERVYTHVKMVIIPDGGVKRLRVFGRLAT